MRLISLLLLLVIMLAGCSNYDEPEILLGDVVTPLYSGSGANWNDYVLHDDVGGSRFNASDTACDQAVGSSYFDCIHGGEMRLIELVDFVDCVGVVISDSLGAFNWTCDDSTGVSRAISTGLKDSKRLADLINWSTAAWKPISVTISGLDVSAITDETVWWSNPVAVNTAGGNLTTAGTIYIVPVSTTADYSITALNGISLVVKPGAVITGANTQPWVVWAVWGNAADIATYPSFLWVEGEFDAGSTPKVMGLNTRYSVYRNIKAYNATSYGLEIVGNSNSYFNNISSMNHGNSGILLNGFTYPNRGNTFNHATTSNNGGQGVHLFGNSNTGNLFHDLVASGNNGAGLFIEGNNNVVISATLNNNWDGLFENSGNNNLYINMAAVNNGSSNLYYTGSTNVNTLNALAAYRQANTDIGFISATGNFNGVIKIGGYSDDGYCAGVVCGNLPGTFFFTNGVNITTTYIGKASADSVNTSDSSGTATYATILDWAGFENRYRAWGVGGSVFPATDQDLQCATGTCRIWDWSLATGDNVALNTLAAPSGNDILNHTWSGGSITTLLHNAAEIIGDGYGNENGLCETNERCLYTPNIGAYQGHGALVAGPSVAAGAILGVTMLQYASNGR